MKKDRKSEHSHLSLGEVSSFLGLVSSQHPLRCLWKQLVLLLVSLFLEVTFLSPGEACPAVGHHPLRGRIPFPSHLEAACPAAGQPPIRSPFPLTWKHLVLLLVIIL